MDLLSMVAALKTFPVFQHASLRLLTDLVDASQAGEVEVRGGNDVAVEASGGMLVLDGTVEVHFPTGDHDATAGTGARPPDGSPVAPGPAPRSDVGRGAGVFLRAGGFVGRRESHTGPLSVRAARTTPSRAVSLEVASIARSIQAAPVLGRSLGIEGVKAMLAGPLASDGPLIDLRPAVVSRLARPRFHFVLLTAAADVDAPLQSLARRLARSLTAQFGEPAEVAVIGAQQAKIDTAQPIGVDLRQNIENVRTDLKERYQKATPGDHALRHLIFVTAKRGQEVPESLAGFFHRIAYLTWSTPDEVPPSLARLLVPQAMSADGDGPLFSSFVSSVLLDPPHRARPRPLLPRLPFPDPLGLRDIDVRSYDVQLDDLPGSPSTPPRRGWRLRRDQCRLRLRLSHPDDSSNAESIDRWARALSNRQVGVALSGGGASSYRLVPFLRELEKHVPVDVVSGVSGGALLGGYYCAQGTKGLHRCVRRGPLFQAALAASVLDSQYTEALLNWDLCRARVEELARRFVPLATALTVSAPPAACVITSGTVGAAVRASGALPGALGPVNSGGRRFVDGGASTLVPAYVLPDHGADFTIAVYSVPAPENRNPLGKIPGADWIYRNTLAGRAIDLLVATSYFLKQVSEAAGKAAHVFVPAGEADLPLALEIFLFARASSIAGQFDGAIAAADMCAARWGEFRSAGAGA
jgi:predicted acylesterase/phospholipase RssA